MQHINDSHIRQRALNPHQSFIVQAPAGSGKTELLTQRYLILLSHAKKAPEEIIAITFTRKAAAEMRARILQALQFAQTPEPNQTDYRHTTWSLAQAVLKRDHELNWHIIRNPNRLRILTIDALSAFLCRQTPLLTQFGATPDVCEQAAPLYQLAAQRLLKDAFANPEWKKHIEHLLLHIDNDAEKCEALFSSLLMSRDQWLPHIIYSYTHHHTLRDTLENGLKNIALEKMHLAAKSMPSQLRQTILIIAQHAGNYFVENQPEHALTHCAQWQWKLKPDLSEVKSWIGLSNLLLTKDGNLRKIVDIRSGFAPKDPNKSLMLSLLTELDSHPEFIDMLKATQLLPPTLYTELQLETITALTTLLPLLAAQLTLIFQEKKQIDFLELNAAALKALGNDDSPTDLSLYLDYQIQHLLIDEFQDTSVTHLHLLEKLIAGWQPNDGRTLFLVGDPMQSIYRFRNAEVGLFLRAQQQGIGSVSLEPLTLTMNFRSQENLVQWFNTTFQAIFPVSSDIPTGRVPYTPAVAARAAIEDGNAHFYPTSSNENEADQIIDTILKIKKTNSTDSIAILVRSRSQLSEIIPALQKQSLDLQATDIDSLSTRPEIRDLLTLTCALHHRADRIAWLSILRAPWCGLTLEDLEIISQHAQKKTMWESLLICESIGLSEDGLHRATFLRHQLQHAYKKQSQLSLSAWVEGVWLGLNGPACLSKSIELDNTRAYFNLLSSIDPTSFSLKTLIEKCESLFANPTQVSQSAIQILTIHKSKGLEFDHVFLPGLHRKIPSDDQRLLQWLERVNAFGGDDLILAPIKSIKQLSDPIYDYLKQVENEKQFHEITRLLYVAATRAKKSLHLLGEVAWDEKENKPKMPAKGSFLEKLFPIVESTVKMPLSNAMAVLPAQTTPALQRLQKDYFLSDFPKADIIKPVKIDISLRSPKAQVIGTIIHEILQAIATKQMDVKDISQQQMISRLLSLAILPSDIPDCLSIIEKAILNTLLDSRGQWILSHEHHDARCEWALTSVHHDELQHIIIDRSFIDENKVRWIIDYKTSQPNENESLEIFFEKEKAQYKEKLQLYAESIQKMENNPIRIGLYFPLVKGWIEWE